MKKRFLVKNLLSALLLMLLVTALALSITSCGKEDDVDAGETSSENTVETTTEPANTEVGEGEKTFTFKVKFKDETERVYTVHTDKEILSDALIEAGLIEGEDGPYGLYVKTVAGETLDYDVDKKYWALYENDGYATNGVSDTTIDESVVYSFVASK